MVLCRPNKEQREEANKLDSPRTSQNAQASVNHVPALDGVRGLAILMVLVLHLFQGFDFSDSWLGVRLHAISSLGQTGVDLFFVLSGYLITGILLKSRESRGYFRVFYARRALRIFPLYYGVLAAILVYYLAKGISSSSQIWLWTYCYNIVTTFAPERFEFGPLPIQHFWSLCVEEHFYALWPLIVYWLGPRRLPGACATCLGVAAGCRFVLEWLGIGSYYFTLSHIDGLALGSWLAVTVGQLGSAAPLIRLARWTLASVALVGLPFYAVFKGEHILTVQVLKPFGFAVFFAALLVPVVVQSSRGLLVSCFSNRLLCSFGKYSYAMYVLHPLVYALLIQAALNYCSARWPTVFAMFPTVRLLLAGAAAIGVSYLTACGSWHLYEKHFITLKRHFELGPKTTAHASVDAHFEAAKGKQMSEPQGQHLLVEP
jgi:peptidoglycan/LPS O-acetylase OafA/YrhL